MANYNEVLSRLQQGVDATLQKLSEERKEPKKTVDKMSESLIETTARGLVERNVSTDEYLERAGYELGVIIYLGVADYFLIIEIDVCKLGEMIGHLKDEDHLYLKEHCNEMNWREIWNFAEARKNDMPGMSKGPGRGSAAGSIVTYALHITDIDPLKYNLLFERE